MAPRTSNTQPEPTLYEILGLTPKQVEALTGSAQAKEVKKAYHKALLKHHPDKSQAKSSPSPPPGSEARSPPPQTKRVSSGARIEQTLTVDQITQAYTVLSDPSQRASYDRALQTASLRATSAQAFHTGFETVDLDDVDFDERRGLYYRSCRCGNPRGYRFTERDLDEVGEDGVLMVECLDCSLWIRVLYAEAEEDEDGGDEGNGTVAAGKTQSHGSVATSGSNSSAARDVASGSGKTEGSGKGLRFSFSWSWGISVSGSADSGVSTG